MFGYDHVVLNIIIGKLLRRQQNFQVSTSFRMCQKLTKNVHVHKSHMNVHRCPIFLKLSSCIEILNCVYLFLSLFVTIQVFELLTQLKISEQSRRILEDLWRTEARLEDMEDKIPDWRTSS